MTADFSKRYGPWAIVTGASSGIGEAFAHALAERGVRSLLLARRAHELERVANGVYAASGVECGTLAVDLADASFIDALEESTQDLDVGLVVSNAGYNPVGTFRERSRAELCRILDVNCRAPLLLAHTFLPTLQARGHGGFLITGSVEGFFGVPHSAPYSASKNYVLALGEALWGESASDDIDVLVLAPSATDTPIIRARNMQNLPGIMQPSEVVEYGLDQLSQGPVVIPGAMNRKMAAGLASMPRTQAVVTMGQAMEAAMKGALNSPD